MRLTQNAAGRWRLETFGELIGYDGENLAYTIRVDTEIEGAEGWTFYADFEYADGTKGTLPLLLAEGVLSADVGAGYLLPGTAVMQIRAEQGDITKKSNIDRVQIEESINATEEMQPPGSSMWDEYARQVAALRNQAQEAAAEADANADRAESAAERGPYIGEDGYWYVWDSAIGEYIYTGQFSGGEAPYIGINGNWFIGAEDTGVPATGRQGQPGAAGKAATITVGTVTTGAAGSNASVSNSGSENAAVLNFTIPRGGTGEPGKDGQPGAAGKAATITVGTVTTSAAGTNASVTNAGDENAAVLNFTIPRGGTGEPGKDGQPGAAGKAATITVGTVTTGAAGTNASVTNAGDENAAVLNFTIPRGPQGDPGKDGTSFTVLGRYDSLSALKAAHPSGVAGEAYAVGTVDENIIYVWNNDIDDWDPIGALQGPEGPAGQPGAAGEAATIQVGTVTTGAAGSNASVTNAGSESAAVLNFTIPRGGNGDPGPQGEPGAAGVSVTKVEQVTTSNADGGSNVIRVTLSNGQTFDFTVKNGSKGSRGEPGDPGQNGSPGEPGANGVSITSVVQTTTGSGDGGSNIITVTLSNGATSTFTVKNGSKGDKGDPGQAGSPGAAGPNQVSTSTATNISGILKGNGSSVSAAVAGTDYTTPSGVNTQIQTLMNRNNGVNAANTNYTTFMARGFAIASAIQAESITIPNGGVVLVYEG